jgi:hypothetical protein
METSTTAVAPPVTGEPATKRWLRWSGILGRFATVQLVVQAVNALTGLLFVRLLSKHDYALFTIASSMQAMLNLLMDCGINAGLLSIGGKVWTNPDDLGRLVRTALHLRRQMAIGALLIVSPISLWLLLSNGASVIEATALTAVVVGAVHFVTAAAVFGVVTKLHSRYSEIQRVELVGAFSRLALALSAAGSISQCMAATAAASVSQGRAVFSRPQAKSPLGSTRSRGRPDLSRPTAEDGQKPGVLFRLLRHSGSDHGGSHQPFRHDQPSCGPRSAQPPRHYLGCFWQRAQSRDYSSLCQDSRPKPSFARRI